MEFNIPLKYTFKNLSLIIGATAFLVSCGSSQQFYDEDGIYSSVNTTATETQDVDPANGNTQIYKNYFEKGAKEFGELEEEGAIFTDIESYTSEGDVYVEGDGFETATGYAAWGDEVQDEEINIYYNSPYGAGFGYGGFGYGYGGFGFGGYGYGYAGYGYGGFGPYYSFWSPWGYRPFIGYGYAYGNSFYNRRGNFNNGFSSQFRGNRNAVAYNSGRRSLNNTRSVRRGSAASAVSASRARLRSSSGRTETVNRRRNTYTRNRGTVSANRNGTNNSRNE